MESRFLKQQSCVGLNVPIIQIVIFAFVFATLYFQTTLIYALAACIFLLATQNGCIWQLSLLESAFAPPGTCYHFEVAAGVYSPWERLIQLHLHYTAHTFVPTIFFTSLVYARDSSLSLPHGASHHAALSATRCSQPQDVLTRIDHSYYCFTS